MNYGRRALESESPEDAAAEDTCTASGGVGRWWDRPAVGSARGWGQPVGLLRLPGWGGERLLLKTREARVAIRRIQMQGWC